MGKINKNCRVVCRQADLMAPHQSKTWYWVNKIAAGAKSRPKLRGRLMVGLRPLEPAMKVRILPPQLWPVRKIWRGETRQQPSEASI